MENKYEDAIERAFQGDEKIIADWTREARGKITVIERELNSLADTPKPRLAPDGAPYNNNWKRRNELESQKRDAHTELHDRIDNSFAHKDLVERAEINGKIAILLDPRNQELQEKSLDASQDYIQSKLKSEKTKNIYEEKITDNDDKWLKASDRFESKLSSRTEIKEIDVTPSKEMEDIEEKTQSSSDRFEMSLTEKFAENKKTLEPSDNLE